MISVVLKFIRLHDVDRIIITLDELFHPKFPDPFYVMLDTYMHYPCGKG